MSGTFEVRDATAADVDFLLDSWLWSSWDYASAGWKLPTEAARLAKQAFVAEHRPRLAALLHESRVRVACSADDAWQILGWAASDGDTLHYAYVKAPFRRQGIARRLWEDAGEPRVVTHKGRATAEIAVRWGLRIALP